MISVCRYNKNIMDDFEISENSDEISNEENQTYTVTKVNTLIKDTLNNLLNKPIKIRGEISNMKSSGQHLYLTLKDSTSCISSIYFSFLRYNNVKDFNNGDNIEIEGRIDCYVKGGNYSLVISKMKKMGIGDLQKDYETLKANYELLGYFDQSRKKQIPENIKTLGILTASTGAALQDILYVLKKNNYTGKVIVKNCIVQGPNCPKSIAEGIKYLTSLKETEIDAILISRGGGSIEDLMGFSNPLVIEAIYNCPVFTISAVGHEVDTMLSDLVADLRAPTPSVAGEIIINRQNKQFEKYNNSKLFFEDVVFNNIRQLLKYYELQLQSCTDKLINPIEKIKDRISRQINSMYEYNKFFDHGAQNKLHQYSNRITTLSNELQKYDIKTILQTGYVMLIRDDLICDSSKDIGPGQKLKIKFKDGEADINIEAIRYE